MTNIESVYLGLLREALFAEAVQVEQVKTWSAGEWSRLEQMVMRQGTSALIYNALLSHKDLCLPDDFKTKIKSISARQMMMYPSQLTLLNKVFTSLREGGVTPVLLKGFGLAELYPRPELRSCGDIDVYVGKDQYHQGAAILRNTFPDSIHHDEEWEELKHYNFILPEGLIEMHRVSIKMEHPRDKRLYYRLEQEGTDPTNVQNLSLREADMSIAVPEAKFNMLFTFMHAWEHFVVEGVGWKQLADVALLAQQVYNQFSGNEQRLKEYRDYLSSALNDLCLVEAWQLVGYMLITCLHLPVTVWQGSWLGGEGSRKQKQWLEKYGERFYRRVMDEGIHRAKDYGDSKNRYEEREKNLKLPVWKRKLKTLRIRFNDSQFINYYSPEYARHLFSTALWKGIRRMVHKEETVLY